MVDMMSVDNNDRYKCGMPVRPLSLHIFDKLIIGAVWNKIIGQPLIKRECVLLMIKFMQNHLKYATKK